MSTLLIEFVHATSPMRVIRDSDGRPSGKLANVRVLGAKSLNKREYTEACMRDSLKRKLYDGRVIHTNHNTKPNETRDVNDRFGWLENLRYQEDKDGPAIWGDMQYLVSHPMAERIAEAAERRPSLFALSHHALGSESEREGKRYVDKLDEVVSVDVISDGGVNRGLWEQKGESRIHAPVLDLATAKRTWVTK